jgi:hypothetical protein
MAHTILKNCNDITEVWGNEISLAYPEKYAGATDLVGVADGKVTLFDWKQTNKPKRQDWSCSTRLLYTTSRIQFSTRKSIWANRSRFY